MISKGSGNGFRPICMDCCAYRAIGATSVVVACARLPFMQPLQFGGGIRNGAEIVARADALAYDQGKAILSIDIKNAFNTTCLSIIHDGLLQADPSLLHYFRWRYGNPSTLRDNTGASVATTCTGVRQGDPWSSLLFEVAIQPSPRRLQARLTDRQRAVPNRHHSLQDGSHGPTARRSPPPDPPLRDPTAFAMHLPSPWIPTQNSLRPCPRDAIRKDLRREDLPRG